MRQGRLGWVALAAAWTLSLGGCAAPTAARPVAPSLVGDDPAVGQPFTLDLVEDGEAVRLEGVPGRTLLLCVLADGEEAAQIVAACVEQSRRWRDRIVVVGLATSADVDPAAVPFRTYPDPGAEAMREGLDLGPGPQVLVVDGRGRIARVVPLGKLEALAPAVTATIPGGVP